MSGTCRARATIKSELSVLFQSLSLNSKEYASMLFTTKCEECEAKATVFLGVKPLCGECALAAIRAHRGPVPKVKGVRG